MLQRLTNFKQFSIGRAGVAALDNALALASGPSSGDGHDAAAYIAWPSY